MRRLKTIFATTVAAGLLVGSAAGVAAQSDEAEGMPHFTGSIGGSVVVGEPTEATVDGVTEVRGLVREGPIEATDPRLTGTLTRVLNFDLLSPTDEIWTVHYGIENEVGSWSGIATGFAHYGPSVSDEQAIDLDTVLLTGEGDYAGLSAYLLANWSPDVGAEIRGLVFSGEMPPDPEPSSVGSS